MNWTPPSLASMDKLSRITIEGISRIAEYVTWFRDHPEIPRTIPPLYQDFTIRYKNTYPDPDSDSGTSRVFEYIDCVHYSEDLTEVTVCHVLDGKKLFTLQSNYAEYERGVQRIPAKANIPASTTYPENWLKNEASAAMSGVLAVQAYILYHKPEIVPVERQQSEKPRKRKTGERKKKSKTIKSTVRQYINLTEKDTPSKVRNYRALQWTVRGHYRRINPEKLVYVRPHLASRKGVEKAEAADPMEIIVKENG